MWVLSTMMIPFPVIIIPLFFYNQKSWTGEFALGHDTSYGSACIWRIPF